MPPTVRPASPADAPLLAEFNRRLARESEAKELDPAVVAAGVAAGLADPHKARYFVAEEGGAILGQLMLTTEWSDWRDGWIWWVQSVYVRADARRRGVSRALFAHVERLARQAGDVIALRLYVEDRNRAAQDTYARLGMAPGGYSVWEKGLL
jgi:GNAT superfamily N-acetyltransferase